MVQKSLAELANHHGSDKGTLSPVDGWPAHNYTDIYEAYLEKYRTSPITLLEIGLGVTGDKWEAGIVRGRNTGGASMKMWYDYLSDARIYGLDINECRYLDNDRIRTFVVDQESESDLDAFAAETSGLEFDIIINDGSHRPDHQQITLGHLFKRLKSDGLYFIEDLLSNGLGDGATGRHARDSVRNTRSVLKHFLKHGEFLEPHALIDPAYLKEHIAYLNFHVPTYSANFRLEGRLRQLFRKEVHFKQVHFEPETERLCVIRKR
jgi:hypothetical protein